MKKIAFIMALSLATTIAAASENAEASVRNLSDAAFDELDAVTPDHKNATNKETVAESQKAVTESEATAANSDITTTDAKSGTAVAERTSALKNETEEASEVPQTAEEESGTPVITAEEETVASAEEYATNSDDTEAENGEVNEHDVNTGTVIDAATVEDYLDFSGAFFPTIHGTTVNSPYGIRRYRLHRGVDLHICIGDSIVAAYPGKVIVSKYNRRGYGHYVMLEHANGSRTLYGHLKKRLVNVGDTVEGGQLVGWGGNTGRSSGPHLHFEIRYGEVNIDPATVFNFEEGRLLENSERYSVADATESHNAIQKELSKHRIHKIRRGDTLGKIARMYGTTIERLCKLNGIKRTTILQIGRRLRCS